MSQNKLQKLELTWIGKGKEPKLEPRILIENPEYSYGDPNSENMLIHGDNLLALKALEQDFAGKVKCIYIDPPYNINAAGIYDDYLEHSRWLGLMSLRLKYLKRLLSGEGVIFIQIDDEEQAYLKVICDEIFGRSNFVNMISVNMKNSAGASGGGEDKRLKKNCEYILIYAKNYSVLPNFNSAYEYTEMYEVVERYRAEKINWHYTSVLVNEGTKEYVDSTVDGDGNEIKVFIRKNPIIKSIRQLMSDDNITEKEVYYKYSDRIFEAKDAQTSIRTRIIEFRKNFSISDDLISIEYIPRSGRNRGKIYEQFYKGDKCRLFAWLRDIGETIDGVLYKKDIQGTYWNLTSSINNLTKEGGVVFPNGKKPEQLIRRIFEMTTEPGDIVLDSFLGSGTTAAVAVKMNRRWIGVELGEHAKTHCYTRLKAVVDGEQGGISKSLKWKGGGGFKFYSLAATLLNEDAFGNKIINAEYDAPKLAAALAKHEGFTFAPDKAKFWKQGYSSEQDYIFTTTHYLTREFLDAIAEDLLAEESLLVCCTQYESGLENAYPNINIRRIPGILLNRCEFKQDSDYSLNIINSPLDELRPEVGERIKPDTAKSKDNPKHTTEMPDLFSQTTNE